MSADQLGLQRMVVQKHRTDFTVSVDAGRGVTTGIARMRAKDREPQIIAGRFSQPARFPARRSWRVAPGGSYGGRSRSGGNGGPQLAGVLL